MSPFLFTILFYQIQTCTIQNHSLSNDFIVYPMDSTIIISDNNITLNPQLEMGSWNIHFKSPFDLTVPFTIKYKFQLECDGNNFPRHIGDGFSFIIHNDGNVGSLGNAGGYLGCCPSNSVNVMFDFLIPNISLLNSISERNSFYIRGDDPTGNWLPSKVNSTKCGVPFDVIVNYDGVYFSSYLESIDMPWFCYKTNFSQLISTSRFGNISWGLGCGGDHLEFILMDVTSYINCSGQNIFNKEPYICTCDGICQTKDNSTSNMVVSSGEEFFIVDRTLILKNLSIEEGGTLLITNGSAIVDDFINQGSLQISLSDNSTAPLIVLNCAELGGTLMVDSTKIPITDHYKILNSNCNSGNFSAVHLLTPSGLYQCSTTVFDNAIYIFSYTCSNNNSLRNSSLPLSSMPLITGCIIGFLVLIMIVVSVNGYFYRKRSFNSAMKGVVEGTHEN